MQYTAAKALDGHLVVVETGDDAYLGVAEVSPDGITVRTGLVGRPVFVSLFDVVDVTPAREHPQVIGA